MSRAKNSASWYDVLEELKKFVAAEYPNGGKLPSAFEMSRKLGVANKTYAKALRALRLHGIARTSLGRMGTTILPQAERLRKIGILLPHENYPALLKPRLYAELLSLLGDRSYFIQLARADAPEKTLRELRVHNISFLLVLIHCHCQKEFAMVRYLRLHDFPVLPVILNLPVEIEQFRDAGLPALSSGVNGNAEALAEFLVAHGCKRLMRLSGSYDRSAELLDSGLCAAAGISLPKNFCAPLNALASRIAGKIRTNAIDAVFAEGSQYEEIWKGIRSIPEPERPWLICHDGKSLDKLTRIFEGDNFTKIALTTCDYRKAALVVVESIDVFFQEGKVPEYKELRILGVRQCQFNRKSMD